MAQLGPWNTGNISFDHNIRATAHAQLTLYSNGAFNFTGTFHNPDLVPYDVSFGWVVVDKSGTAFVFSTKGKVAGSITPGSQDYDWNNGGTNPAIQGAWPQLVSGQTYKWQVNISADIGELINAIINALKTSACLGRLVCGVSRDRGPATSWVSHERYHDP